MLCCVRRATSQRYASQEMQEGDALYEGDRALAQAVQDVLGCGHDVLFEMTPSSSSCCTC
jgi:hypothetical protein